LCLPFDARSVGQRRACHVGALGKSEKLTANQWKIIATANVGDMLDFFDFFLISYVRAFILKDW
jgi:hypothetical protein